jgi:hypothetical protein
MVEIQQISALAAKALAHLRGDPWRAIAHTMQTVTLAEASALGAGAQLPPRHLHVTQQRGAVHHVFAALQMGQADLGLLPLHAFAFAPISHIAGVAHGGHHRAVQLRHKSLLRAHLLRQTLCKPLADAVNGLSVAQRHLTDRALADHDAVMLHKLVHRLGKRHVGSKIGHHALQQA